MDLIIIIRPVILLASSILIILAAVGILRFKDDIERVLYARIHILGIRMLHAYWLSLSWGNHYLH